MFRTSKALKIIFARLIPYPFTENKAKEPPKSSVNAISAKNWKNARANQAQSPFQLLCDVPSKRTQRQQRNRNSTKSPPPIWTKMIPWTTIHRQMIPIRMTIRPHYWRNSTKSSANGPTTAPRKRWNRSRRRNAFEWKTFCRAIRC